MFEEQRGQLWFKDNAFVILEVGKDGIVALKELDETVSAQDIRPMPINKSKAGNIYYDPIIAASIVGPGDKIPVYSTDYTYFMDAFERVMEPDATTLRSKVDEGRFKYVHELQHWLREQHGTDDLKVHHKLITMAEAQYRNLWKLRDDLIGVGVSSYQFLYEMANMLYLRWMSFYSEKEAVCWTELENTEGDVLLDKYQKAIKRCEQQTRIYSSTVLKQAIEVVGKCAREENIAELFDLMLKENSRTKDGGAPKNYTPQVLSELLVELLEPRLGEYWHDPAAGFSGFLVKINQYLRNNNNDYKLLTRDEKAFQLTEAISGMEIQKDIAWIGYCNTRFHRLWCDVNTGDSLEVANYQLYDGIICEPPMPLYSLTGRTPIGNENKNRQTGFVEHILNSLSLQSGSRAAILLPESFLTKGTSEYRLTRKRLFEDYNLHTILRLPQGIYPGNNIPMYALFIEQRSSSDGKVMVYDMQSRKLKPEKVNDITIFKNFVKAYRTRTLDKYSTFVSIDEIRDHDYTIVIGDDLKKEESKLDAPLHYLQEANNVVRDIRSLLSRLEKEVNG